MDGQHFCLNMRRQTLIVSPGGRLAVYARGEGSISLCSCRDRRGRAAPGCGRIGLKTALVIGASGGIGGGFVRALAADGRVERVIGLSRSGGGESHPKVSLGRVDIAEEQSIIAALSIVQGPIDLAIVASGYLHDKQEGTGPEKTWRHLSAEAMKRAYVVNTIGPALLGKHILPRLPKGKRGVFAVLSARVGSISDNRLGGWHSYRASKAAVNMILKNFAIELARSNPHGVVCGLHPGTVDTTLSAPFQANVAPGKLFKPDQSARCLLRVLDDLTPEDSGGCIAWDGERIKF